jgi:hypothetical protein
MTMRMQAIAAFVFAVLGTAWGAWAEPIVYMDGRRQGGPAPALERMPPWPAPYVPSPAEAAHERAQAASNAAAYILEEAAIAKLLGHLLVEDAKHGAAEWQSRMARASAIEAHAAAMDSASKLDLTSLSAAAAVGALTALGVRKAVSTVSQPRERTTI